MTPAGGRLGRRAAAAALGVAVGVAAAAVAVRAGAAGGPGEAGDVVTVTLTARHSRFTPASVTVPAGAAVRFVVRNLDPVDHELIVGDAAVHARHRAGREAHHHGDVPGEVSVPAGSTAATTWTAPATAGGVAFACHLPGHLAYGMSGAVRVSPRS